MADAVGGVVASALRRFGPALTVTLAWIILTRGWGDAVPPWWTLLALGLLGHLGRPSKVLRAIPAALVLAAGIFMTLGRESSSGSGWLVAWPVVALVGAALARWLPVQRLPATLLWGAATAAPLVATDWATSQLGVTAAQFGWLTPVVLYATGRALRLGPALAHLSILLVWPAVTVLSPTLAAANTLDVSWTLHPPIVGVLAFALGAAHTRSGRDPDDALSRLAAWAHRDLVVWGPVIAGVLAMCVATFPVESDAVFFMERALGVDHVVVNVPPDAVFYPRNELLASHLLFAGVSAAGLMAALIAAARDQTARGVVAGLASVVAASAVVGGVAWVGSASQKFVRVPPLEAAARDTFVLVAMPVAGLILGLTLRRVLWLRRVLVVLIGFVVVPATLMEWFSPATTRLTGPAWPDYVGDLHRSVCRWMANRDVATDPRPAVGFALGVAWTDRSRLLIDARLLAMSIVAGLGFALGDGFVAAATGRAREWYEAVERGRSANLGAVMTSQDRAGWMLFQVHTEARHLAEALVDALLLYPLIVGSAVFVQAFGRMCAIPPWHPVRTDFDEAAVAGGRGRDGVPGGTLSAG